MKINFTSLWYRGGLHPVVIFLLPISWIFAFCVFLRRWLYRIHVLKTISFKVPVIVVGNITVGGTGKTPFTIALVKLLQAQGYRPGIVTRGVGGKKQNVPRLIEVNDLPSEVGDEAILLANNTQCPIVIGVNRVAATRELIDKSHCDVVISDDGLQHYRLGRTLEIAMVDGIRYFGNQYLLPAGPLREPISRLNSADFTVVNGDTSSYLYTVNFQPREFVSLLDAQQKKSCDEFLNLTVHAVAAIGHPQRFFSLLRELGINIIEHVFPDHYLYEKKDLQFSDNLPIIMTEKDAVKCLEFADERYWYMKIDVKMNSILQENILKKIHLREITNEVKADDNVYTCHINQCTQPDNIRR